MSKKNNKTDSKNVNSATLGGALFPMSLGMLAGVVLSGSPVVNLLEVQEKLQVQLSKMEEAYIQDVSVGSALTGGIKMPEIAGISEEEARSVVVYKPNQWVINKKTSTLSFEALQYGQKFSGSFDFDGEVIFDPENLVEASVSIEIDITSIATGSLTRDGQARTKDWFDVDVYPKATFKSVAFTKSGEGEGYVAHGLLNLRGADVPIDLPFSLKFNEESPENGEKKLAKINVEMTSHISLSRFELGIGRGEWGDEDVISDKVDIFIVLQAHKP